MVSSADTSAVASSGLSSPIISIKDVGVQFSRGRRNKGLRELLFKRKSGIAVDEFWALRNVSFDVSPGEAIGVVGRNGQGKSTLLRVVAGVMLPDEGDARVSAGVAPLIEITGGFVPDLTGRENIYLAAGLHGMPRKLIDEKFDEIVEFAEVDDFLDTPFRHYSSGMRVRLAFAVISRLDEPILLVDEVLAVGDKAFKKKCYNRIDEMLEGGKTLFLVSHSDGDLKRFCTRGLYLRGGELRADGPIKDVLDQYGREG
jgi:ABC-2 type transport system ATP-binding protein